MSRIKDEVWFDGLQYVRIVSDMSNAVASGILSSAKKIVQRPPSFIRDLKYTAAYRITIDSPLVSNGKSRDSYPLFVIQTSKKLYIFCPLAKKDDYSFMLSS